jgi:hypothetical protein
VCITARPQDNSTFLHIPFWADDQTSAVSVGLLLGLTAAEARVDVQSFVQSLAGSKPLGARNFVLAVDPTNLAGVLSSSPTARTSVPFLMYVSGNVSISTAVLKAKVVPVNRPLYVIGKSTDRTSIDFGMEVNTLQLGPQGSILFNQLILENLAPGDARSAALAGSYEVLMPYNVWAVAFDRCGQSRAPVSV